MCLQTLVALAMLIDARAASRSQSAPHMHVVVCICNNVREIMGTLHELETEQVALPDVSISLASAVDLLTVNVEHTVKTKVRALRRLLQQLQYPAVVLLQEVGVLPKHFVVHCLYWHTHT